MTLVVADIDETGIFVVGDSRLTDHRVVTQPNALRGALKLIIVRHSLCIAYAGNHEVALDAVRWSIPPADAPCDTEAIEQSLLHHHTRTSGGADFIIASTAPTPRLTTISDGAITGPSGGRCWIGDSAAFSAFQRAWTSTVADSSSVAARGVMLIAMQQVIDDQAHPSVGDTLVAAFSSKLGFVYSASISAEAGGSQSIPSGVETAIQFGQGAPAGSHTLSVLTPPDGSAIGAIGVFVQEAAAGVVYYPLKSAAPLRFAAATQHDFIERVERELGLRLSGPYLS